MAGIPTAFLRHHHHHLTHDAHPAKQYQNQLMLLLCLLCNTYIAALLGDAENGVEYIKQHTTKVIVRAEYISEKDRFIFRQTHYTIH